MTIHIGIDWSREKHDVAITNEKGAILERFTIQHDVTGFTQLDERCRKLGMLPANCFIAIESAHSVLVDYLWVRDYQNLYIVPPHLTAASRGRYSVSKAHTDQTDAFVIAELLRTDRHQLQRYQPSGLLTRQLRHQVQWQAQQGHELVRHTNRLRDLLHRYYPAALNLFSDLNTQITLTFIAHHPHPQEAAALDFHTFATFAQAHGYCSTQHLPKQYARFQQPVPEASPETIAIYQLHGQALATTLLQLVKQHAESQRRLTQLFQQHADAPIFSSFPGLGKWLAPAMLAKFGDDRNRFPTAMSLQALAGTCPATHQSGKRRHIKFRQACDKSFRQFAQQWAWCSLPLSPWANGYFQRHTSRQRHENDALRRLANRWLAIAWTCWQRGVTYDEAYHLEQCRLRRQPRRS